MKNVNVYIDGFNLYHAIDALGDNRLKWISFWALGLSFLKPKEHLNSVTYFTAVLTWNKEKQQSEKVSSHGGTLHLFRRPRNQAHVDQ